jgi:aspartyl-tRNA(Asn)/glutamyl-tRNA(Gln) amidotransferase subunit C
MVELDEALTRRVANLSRLELTDAEAHLFTAQIGEILKYVDQLQKVDVSSVEPLYHPLSLDAVAPLREDVAKNFGTDADGSLKVLKPAPDVADGGFKVPPVL